MEKWEQIPDCRLGETRREKVANSTGNSLKAFAEKEAK